MVLLLYPAMNFSLTARVKIENFELTSESTLEGRILRSSNNNGIYIVGCQMPEDNPAIMEYVAGKLEKQKKSPRH